jgi:hypothetical protein
LKRTLADFWYSYVVKCKRNKRVVRLQSMEENYTRSHAGIILTGKTRGKRLSDLGLNGKIILK